MFDSSLIQYGEGNSVQNPLLKFKLSSLKMQRHSFHLKQLAAKQKLKAALSLNLKNESAHASRNDLSSKLQLYATQVPVPFMPNSIKTKILSFVPKAQLERCPKIVKAYMEDVQKHYNQLMYKYSIEQLLRNDELEHNDKKGYTTESRRIKLKSNKNFEKASKQLQKSFFLVQKPVRIALEFLICKLPVFKFNLNLATSEGVNRPQGLQGRSSIPYRFLFNSMRRDIEDYNNLLRLTWYPEFIDLLKQQIGTKNVCRRLYNCLEGLISRRIIEIKQNVLSNFLKILGNERLIPLLSFKLEIRENCVILNPSLEALENIYVSLALNIANIGVEMLPSLATELLSNNNNFNYIKLKMNEIYLAELIADIKHTIKHTYEPIITYVEDFQRRYECLFISLNETRELSDVTSNFETIFETIENYSKLKIIIQLEPKNIYFLSGIIQNKSALQQLSNITENLKKQSSEKLIIQHIILLQEICADFEELRSRALKIPTSTEELLALVEFVNNMEIKQLHERVKFAQHIGNQLLDVTNLSEKHLALSIRTLNWLREIQVIREMGATQLEHFYAVFKAHLKVLEDKLNHDIENLAKRVQLLSNITDFTEFREYRVFIQNIFQQFNELEDCVNWINKEEYLFGKSRSHFEALEELGETIRKFVK